MAIGKPWFRLGISAIVTLVLVAFGATVFQERGVEPGAPPEQFAAYLDRRIPSLMDDYDIPGVIFALVDSGKPVRMDAYGYADLEADRKMTVDTICRVESISKSLTAWGVMKLVEQGRIDLDTPVQEYIASWEFPKTRYSVESVTPGLLLSGSAGLPLGTIGVHYPPTAQDIPTLKERLSEEAVLLQEPGSRFFYSNAGYYLLELLIEEVTGRDFAEYMEEEVLLPLEMTHSSFTWRESFDPPVPNGYDGKGNPIPVYVYPAKASGGLFSTVEDVALFAIAGMTGFSDRGQRVLNTKSIETIYTPQIELSGYYRIVFDTYGLGHFIETLPNGMKAVSHGGQGSGWMTHFHSVPETGDAIVIFSNSQRSWPFFAYILRDWARWNGFSSVGFAGIIRARTVFWILIAVLFFVVQLQVWRLADGLFSGTRRFAPLSGGRRGLRIVEIVSALGIASALGWIVTREYFFLNSVFPIASGWLWIALLLSAVVLLLSAMMLHTPVYHIDSE